VFVALVTQHTKRVQRIISVKYQLFLSYFKKTLIFRHFKKNSNIIFNENLSSWSRDVPCGRTNGQTDIQTNMTKVTVALRFTNASKTTFVYRRLPIAEFVSASF